VQSVRLHIQHTQSATPSFDGLKAVWVAISAISPREKSGAIFPELSNSSFSGPFLKTVNGWEPRKDDAGVIIANRVRRVLPQRLEGI
jgi:hypothetical protein